MKVKSKKALIDDLKFYRKEQNRIKLALKDETNNDQTDHFFLKCLKANEAIIRDITEQL